MVYAVVHGADRSERAFLEVLLSRRHIQAYQPLGTALGFKSTAPQFCDFLEVFRGQTEIGGRGILSHLLSITGARDDNADRRMGQAESEGCLCKRLDRPPNQKLKKLHLLQLLR